MMKTIIDFKEIEHLIFKKFDLRTEIERNNDDTVIFHIKSIGLLGTTSNWHLSIDRTYDTINSLKLRISGNILSNFAIPQLLKHIDFNCKDAINVENDGNIIVNLAEIVQLKRFFELYTLNYVSFTKSAVNAEFTLII